MAGFVLTTAFEKGALEQVRDLLETLFACLYTNEHDPTPDDTADDYIQPVAAWYDPLPLDSWGSIVETDAGIPAVYHPVVSWEATSGDPVSIQGFFVLDSSGRLCWSFPDPDRPFLLFVGGPSYSAAPRFTLRQDPDL